MNELDKAECMENLEFLGILDILDRQTSQRGSFSLDVPNGSALPTILRCLFDQLDSKECQKRFKDCWPIHSKNQRLQFRHNALDWLDELRITEPQGTLPEFSKMEFDAPQGERFVKFLLEFTTLVIRKKCQNRKGFYPQMENSFFGSVDSLNSDSSDCHDQIDDLNRQLVDEAIVMDTLREEAMTRIQSLQKELCTEEEQGVHACDLLCEHIDGLSRHLKWKPVDPNVKLSKLGEDVIRAAMAYLEEYKATWDQLVPLFDAQRNFNSVYATATSEKQMFKGIDGASKMKDVGLFQDVCQADGRLDIFKLVNSLRKTITSMRESMDNMGKLKELAVISENSRKAVSVLTLLVQEQKDIYTKMASYLSEIESSLQSAREEASRINEIRRPRPAPDWLCPPRPLKLPPVPEFNFRQTRANVDWYQVCANAGISCESNERVPVGGSFNIGATRFKTDLLDDSTINNSSKAVVDLSKELEASLVIDQSATASIESPSIEKRIPPSKKFRISITPNSYSSRTSDEPGCSYLMNSPDSVTSLRHRASNGSTDPNQAETKLKAAMFGEDDKLNDAASTIQTSAYGH